MPHRHTRVLAPLPSKHGPPTPPQERRIDLTRHPSQQTGVLPTHRIKQRQRARPQRHHRAHHARRHRARDLLNHAQRRRHARGPAATADQHHPAAGERACNLQRNHSPKRRTADHRVTPDPHHHPKPRRIRPQRLAIQRRNPPRHTHTRKHRSLRLKLPRIGPKPRDEHKITQNKRYDADPAQTSAPPPGAASGCPRLLRPGRSLCIRTQCTRRGATAQSSRGRRPR